MADPAPAEPLGLSAVKLNLRVNGTAEDSAIEDLITDARELVEDKTGLILVPRTVTETAEALGRGIDLSSWPVRGISAIRYPLAGVMTDLPTTAWQYSPARRPVRLLPAVAGWGVAPFYGRPGTSLPIEIDVEAGYATPADIPRRALRAMHMLIAHWYENRQTAEVGSRAAAVEVPFGFTELCQRLKMARI